MLVKIYARVVSYIVGFFFLISMKEVNAINLNIRKKLIYL